MRLLILLLSIILLAGCMHKPTQRQAIPIIDSRKLPPPHSLTMTSPVTSDTLEWGARFEIPIEILWVSGHKIPVQLAPAPGTPGWLKVEIEPASVDTSAHISVHLTPLPGLAPTGRLPFVLQASSDSLPQPVRKEFKFYVRRQTGNFTRLEFGIEPHTCDSVCARISPWGELTFYDLRPGGSCTDTVAMPESQRLGMPGMALSQKGYAFGANCRLAAVYESSGMLSFINLGLSPRVPLGAILLSLRGASACWLSPDNSLALISMPGAAIPYEIASGRALGGPCRLQSDTVTVRIHNGSILRAGQCKWELQ